MPTTATAPLRPFHETILEAIRRIQGRSEYEIFCLLRLIQDTDIPKGHDEILAAIEYFDCITSEQVERAVRKTRESLLAQKKACDAKNASVQNGAKLDELQLETIRLLSLLDDPHPGLATWHQLMRDRAESMHRLLSQALGK